MFTPGPRTTGTPSARASRPTAVPIRSAPSGHTPPHGAALGPPARAARRGPPAPPRPPPHRRPDPLGDLRVPARPDGDGRREAGGRDALQPSDPVEGPPLAPHPRAVL